MATKEQTNETVTAKKDEAAIMVESEDADAESLTQQRKREEADSSEKLGPFMVKTWMEDLTLEVEGKNFYVSKMVLATVCPGFRKTFESEIATEKIVLSGKKYEDVREFLLCVYPNPDTLKKINETNVMTVVPFIAEYQVSNLLVTCDSCVCVIVDGLDSVKDLLFYLEKATAYGLVGAKEKCLNLLNRKDVEEIEQSKVFGELPQELKVEVFAFMAKRLNKLVKEQKKTLDLLNKVKENHEQFKKCFLAGFPRNKRAEIALLTTSGSIHFEFTPMTWPCEKLTSKSVNCGESALQLQVNTSNAYSFWSGKTYDSYLIADLIFTRKDKKYYVKYDLVNNFSNSDNVVKCNERDNKVSIIKWTYLIDESRGYLRDGKVNLYAYFLLA